MQKIIDWAKHELLLINKEELNVIARRQQRIKKGLISILNNIENKTC